MAAARGAVWRAWRCARQSRAGRHAWPLLSVELANCWREWISPRAFATPTHDVSAVPTLADIGIAQLSSEQTIGANGNSVLPFVLVRRTEVAPQGPLCWSGVDL